MHTLYHTLLYEKKQQLHAPPDTCQQVIKNINLTDYCIYQVSSLANQIPE